MAIGAYYGISSVYSHFSTRKIHLCVMTDFEYREQKPDWESSLNPLFAEINRLFEKTGVSWQVTYGGEAYPPAAVGDIAKRAALLEQSGCRADIVLGLSGRPDKSTNSVALPFAHTLLVEDTAADTRAISATVIARALAELFGVPVSTQTLIVTDAAQDGVFDAAAVQIIREMRDYDFARGVSALAGSWEKRAVAVLAGTMANRIPHADAEAHRIVSRAFAAGRQYDDAVRQLREAVREDPQNSRLRYELAMRLEEDSDSEDAIGELKTVARMEPQDSEPHAAMGAIYLNARRVDEAIDELRIATTIDPHNASYQAVLGEALARRQGSVRAAAAAYEAAVRLKPSEPGAYAGLVRETNIEQLLQEAARLKEGDVRQRPASAEAHLKLGIAYAQAGNLDGAKKETARAIELQPGNGAAHLVMARLDYLGGQYEAADTELRAAKTAGANPNPSLVNAVNHRLGRPTEEPAAPGPKPRP